MQKTEPISRFYGRWWFLSNFYPSPVYFGGQPFPTVEHAFQAAKTQDAKHIEQIRLAPSPAIAKTMGRGVKLRQGWEDIKVEVMRGFLRQKFGRDPELGEMLIATHPRELIEGNTWRDTFWGVCNGYGQNHLGKLLMEVRTELLERKEHAAQKGK